MNAVRIRKQLKAPIPELPELTPLIGKTVEIIVLEEASGSAISRRVRVTGQVDAAGDGDAENAFTLRLDTGAVLRAEWCGVEPSPMPALSSARVVVDGLATFDLCGALIQLMVDAVAAARPGDDLFSRIPHSLSGRADFGVHQPQGPGIGADAVFGQWPGDESDEELLRMLEEIEE